MCINIYTFTDDSVRPPQADAAASVFEQQQALQAQAQQAQMQQQQYMAYLAQQQQQQHYGGGGGWSDAAAQQYGGGGGGQWAENPGVYAQYMAQAYPPYGNPYGGVPFDGATGPTELKALGGPKGSPAKRKGPRTGGFAR